MPIYQKQSVKTLLRPPLEWATAVILLGVALICCRTIRYVELGSGVAWWVCLPLLAMVVYQLYQGSIIWRYQRGLRKQRCYRLKVRHIKSSRRYLFLGRGFYWQPIHTQRLRELDLPQFYRYRQLPATNTRAWRYNAPRFAGGDTALHGVGFQDKKIAMPLADRSGHTVVLGTTGVGKTRFAELLISQDILRGDTVIVIDPKGDAALLRHIVLMAKKAKRLNAVNVLHLGFPELSIPYNPIARFTRLTEVAGRITQPLPGSGDSAAFKAFAWQFIDTICACLVFLDQTPTYRQVAHYLSDRDALLIAVLKKDNPEIEAWLTDYQDNHKDRRGKTPSRDQAIAAYMKTEAKDSADCVQAIYRLTRYDAHYYDKITASAKPLLRKLTAGDLGDLLSPATDSTTQSQAPLNWLNVINDKQIIYVALDALSDSTVAAAVGNALLADLVSTAGYLYNNARLFKKKGRPRICLHVDEFNEIIGNEFMPLLNKARGAGFQVTAYTQTWSDVEARLGNRAKAGQVAGNFNTLIMLRVKEAKTVDMLLNQLACVPFVTPLPPQPSSRYVGERIRLKDVPLLQQNDIINLPKGEAFALVDGGKLVKLRLPELRLNRQTEKKCPAYFPVLIEWLKKKQKPTS